MSQLGTNLLAKLMEISQLENFESVQAALKLEAQAEFVFWWDTQAEKFKGGDQRDRSVTLLVAGVEGLPPAFTYTRHAVYLYCECARPHSHPQPTPTPYAPRRHR